MNKEAAPANIGKELASLRVGFLTTSQLHEALMAAHVGLNEMAQTLLNRPEMQVEEGVLNLVTVSPADLGFADGVGLTDFFAAAENAGLHLCPLATGPYLRLVHHETPSTDLALRRQRPPEGALHIASPILQHGFDTPKGFYLRTVDGQRWLRGYRCDDDYLISVDRHYVFTADFQTVSPSTLTSTPI